MSLAEAVSNAGTPSQIAERIRHVGMEWVQSRHISDLIFQRRLDLEQCPVVAGRRLIPLSMIPEIMRLLQARRRRVVRREVAADAS
jgi:hypothetical protein